MKIDGADIEIRPVLFVALRLAHVAGQATFP
jgi:hypothetical protein